MKNERLRKARKERRWTIEEASARIGVSRTTYIRWEQGTQKPQDLLLSWACKAFNLTAEQLGFAAWPGQTEADEPQETTVAPAASLTGQPEPRSMLIRLTRAQAEWIATLLDLRGDTVTAFDPSKRETLEKLRKLLAAAGVATLGTQFAGPEPWEQLERLVLALKKPSSIDSVTLQGLKNATESYWQLRVHGSIAAPDLLDTVLQHYRTLTQLLQGPLAPTTRTFLNAVASETTLLAGMLFATDMHKHDEAQWYYNTALVVAQQANNDALYAAGLGRMSALATTIGNPREARSLLQEAQRLVRQSDTFTLRAWLAAEEAEVQAVIAAQENTQNTSACFKALDKAETFASQMRSGEDSFGMYFDLSRIPAYRGSTNLRLHHPDEALEALQEALEPLEPSGALRRAVLLDLAEASIQASAVEQACDYIMQALEIIFQMRAMSSLRRVYGLRQQLKPWSAAQAVKNLDERLEPFSSSLMREEEGTA